MLEAKILHCEDDEDIREAVELMLSISGLHRVIAHATRIGQALNLLQDIKAGTLPANVILLDGNLDGQPIINHPRYIVDRAKSFGLHTPIIGLSAEGLAQKRLIVGPDIWADLKKVDACQDPRLLIRTLDGLPEPEQMHL